MMAGWWGPVIAPGARTAGVGGVSASTGLGPDAQVGRGYASPAPAAGGAGPTLDVADASRFRL